MATELWEIGLVIISTFFNGAAPIYLKKGMNLVKGINFNSVIFNKNLIMGIVIYGMSYFVSIYAFKGGDVSVLYPFIALAYIWVSLFSMKFLEEKMNVIKWLGILLIIIGVSFIGFGR